MVPEKLRLEDYFPIGKVTFQGLCYTLRRGFISSTTNENYHDWLENLDTMNEDVFPIENQGSFHSQSY